MKNLCVLLLVIVGGRTLAGCSDDGVYTPVEAVDPPSVVACEEKSGCLDGGTNATDAGK